MKWHRLDFFGNVGCSNFIFIDSTEWKANLQTLVDPASPTQSLHANRLSTYSMLDNGLHAGCRRHAAACENMYWIFVVVRDAKVAFLSTPSAPSTFIYDYWCTLVSAIYLTSIRAVKWKQDPDMQHAVRQAPDCSVHSMWRHEAVSPEFIWNIGIPKN